MREKIIPHPKDARYYRVFWCLTEGDTGCVKSRRNRQPSMKCSEEDCEYFEWEEEDVPDLAGGAADA
jgi:hypothetical protein